jgi:hypothetical protein
VTAHNGINRSRARNSLGPDRRGLEDVDVIPIVGAADSRREACTVAADQGSAWDRAARSLIDSRRATPINGSQMRAMRRTPIPQVSNDGVRNKLK